MLDSFHTLIGSFGNTYSDLILLFGCIIIILFVCTSILQLFVSFFKR